MFGGKKLIPIQILGDITSDSETFPKIQTFADNFVFYKAEAQKHSHCQYIESNFEINMRSVEGKMVNNQLNDIQLDA